MNRNREVLLIEIEHDVEPSGAFVALTASDPLETNPGEIIHEHTLAIIAANGKMADLIPTASWAPDAVIASAENVAGSCGGSISTGIVVLDSVVFVLGVGILGGFLIWITRRAIIKERC
jgi:hypothetical protein